MNVNEMLFQILQRKEYLTGVPKFCHEPKEEPSINKLTTTTITPSTDQLRDRRLVLQRETLTDTSKTKMNVRSMRVS